MLNRALFWCAGLFALTSIAEAGSQLRNLASDSNFNEGKFKAALEVDLALMRAAVEKLNQSDTSSENVSYDNGETYNSFAQRIDDRFFFSWHFQALNFQNRMHLATGLYKELIGVFNLLKRDQSDTDVPADLVCTENNYKKFISSLDGILFAARNIEKMKEVQTSPDPSSSSWGQIWKRLDALWNASFYLWFYMDKMEDQPKNAYPAWISLERYQENQAIVDKNVEQNKKAEKWKPDLTHYNDIAQGKKKPSGIKNPGNQCYANATMQALQAIPSLNSKIHTFLDTTYFTDNFQWQYLFQENWKDYVTNSYEGGLRWLTKELGFSEEEQSAETFLEGIFYGIFIQKTNDNKTSTYVNNSRNSSTKNSLDKIVPGIFSTKEQEYFVLNNGNLILGDVGLKKVREQEAVDKTQSKTQNVDKGQVFVASENFGNKLSVNGKDYNLRSMVVHKGGNHYVAIVRYGEKWFYVSDSVKIEEGTIHEYENGKIVFSTKQGYELCSFSPTLLFYSVLTPDEWGKPF